MVNRWFPQACGVSKNAEPDMKTTFAAALMFRLGLPESGTEDAR
jgi:hypothetical protein